ncbi:MAG: tetratricopeptide repeat protein [Planctomycetaceae bacterium]
MPGVAYVGSAACLECHREEHKSYLQTAHSRALTRVDPAEEPADARFQHQASGRTYSVYRRAGRLRHRETLPGGKTGELLLGDFPMEYTIGSGHHSRSYLFEQDGFLMESPVTWYAAKHAWGMSPGYDQPTHGSFTRPADVGCLHCHAGRVEPVGGSLHRLQIHELAVGCERCHGPGSLHVKLRTSQSLPDDADDRTIVHPAKLSRELNEAICAQCHLRGAATSIIGGRKLSAFRPGLPLEDFRVDYQLELPATSMKVTGHLQQMRMSRCYTQSKTLTCTTCHNPHDTPAPEKRVQHYRSKCLSCHESEGGDGCRLAPSVRAAKSPQNDCLSCHMPRVPTDIPHFAFTHHRIGKNHARRYEDPKPDGGRLVPIGGVSHLSPRERDRCLGLAYLEFSGLSPAASADVYAERAFSLLDRVYRSGARDPTVLAALARLHWSRESPECIALATQALKSPGCPPRARANALFILGESQLRAGQVRAAIQSLEALVRIRRHPEAWVLLAIARSRNGDAPGAIRAFVRALAIRPDRPDVHSLLADEYARIGKPADARRHRETADRLSRRLGTRNKRPP